MATRNNTVKIAKSYIGAEKGSKKHKKLVDTFNKKKPHGEVANYKCDWCAISWTAWCLLAGLTDKEAPMSYNCGTLVSDAKKLGIWKENDEHKDLKVGDGIIYYWSASKGEVKYGADHVGMIVSVSSTKIKVIEGNYSTLDKVAYRTIPRDYQYIRGYIKPKYKTANEQTREDIYAWAKKYAADNSFGYRKWTDNKYTHQCPLCHPTSNKHAKKGWNCIGFVSAAYHHNGVKITCSNSGLGNNAFFDECYKNGKFDIKKFRKRNGNDFKVVTKPVFGDICLCYNKSTGKYVHTALVGKVSSKRKIVDATSSYGIKVRYLSDLSKYKRVYLHYTGKGKY